MWEHCVNSETFCVQCKHVSPFSDIEKGLSLSKKNLDDKFDDLSSDYLIITKSHLNDYKNQLILNDFPLKINQIIERINLKFLKHKFNTQSDISIGPYKLNLNSREISKDKNIISLTEREINLVLFLKNYALSS